MHVEKQKAVIVRHTAGTWTQSQDTREKKFRMLTVKDKINTVSCEQVSEEWHGWGAGRWSPLRDSVSSNNSLSNFLFLKLLFFQQWESKHRE